MPFPLFSFLNWHQAMGELLYILYLHFLEKLSTYIMPILINQEILYFCCRGPIYGYLLVAGKFLNAFGIFLCYGLLKGIPLLQFLFYIKLM